MSKFKGKYTQDDGGRSKYFSKTKISDCVIRAFSIALDQDYKVTMKDLFNLGLEMGDLPNSKVVWRKYAEQKGFVRHSTPKDKMGRKISIRNWSADAPSGSVLVLTREHLVAVVDNVQRDTWLDERTVSSYYTKEVA
tara:strand:- start:1551 stop:1961 length:411 start_codon:yes stop_codon:yes gene_type:complete